MASIPYSIILTHKNNVLSLSDVQTHQNFCKKFLKAQQYYEKYNNNSKSKITFINSNVYLSIQKSQNQTDILNWLETLNQEDRLSLFSIKNKWLINIFSQMFYIYYKMGNYSYKPLSEMSVFFNDQKNYTSKENDYLLNFLLRILEPKNIKFNPLPLISSSTKKNQTKIDDKDFEYDEMNLLSNFFQFKEIIDEKYIHSEQRKMEKKFIENIRVIFDENDNCDTITFTKDFIMNIDYIKKFLEFFSQNKYFHDWLFPINVNNIYNFVLPNWLYQKNDLSFCQIILGFLEQRIVINYEYYYYTKKLYEFSFDKKIIDLYKENQELEKFMYDNYSFNGNDKTKEEIFTSERIINAVEELRGNIIFNKKIKAMKELFNKICETNACYKGKEIIFDDELSLETYNYLNDEILKGKENNYISKLLNLITFNRFFDIINFKNYIFLNYRKKLINLQSNSLLNEIQSDGFLTEKKSGKKHKKKKKKETEEKKSQNVITKTNVINMPVYEVQTNEIECEYNMQQCNMIQENTTNVSINSKTNNNIVITENKKEVIKKPEIKKEIITKSTIIKEENKDKEKEILKKEEKDEEIKKGKKEVEKVDKIKDKKSKEFYLFTTNNINNKKKQEKNENTNTNNNINNEVKKKKKKGKKQKKEIKEEKKETNPKNTIKFNYVQERKNIVQINPCPRRKKHFLLQTSSMNFEMHMKPPTYNHSFNLNKKPQNSKDNLNISNINNMNNTQKSHWDYFQYNINQVNSLQLFNSFAPSEKYFDSLDKELTNYLLVTNSNISLLKNIQEQHMKKLETFLQEKLSNNYEIKFGHYGSFFTELNIEGSDLDILIYYKKKKEDCDLLKDILTILKEYTPEFEIIKPILTASVPVIKLQIDIKNEIKDLKLKQTSYLEEDDLNKIKIDLTFTENEKDFQNSNETVIYIKNSLQEFSQIKPILQILKRYFKIMGMNKSYTGGLCSYSLFLLVLSFCKCNKQCLSPTKLLYYFMENFTYFDYCNYCIDVKSENCYILKEKDNVKIDLNIEKSISEENSSFDTNYDLYEKEEIFIVDPINSNNVSKSSFRVDEIILTFRKGFNLLYYEGWYYDCFNGNNNSKENNRIIENINELYEEDDPSGYMTIKKLFKLKALMNSFDFYFN